MSNKKRFYVMHIDSMGLMTGENPHTIEVEDWTNDANVLSALVDVGSLTAHVTLDDVIIHGDDTVIHVDDAVSGHPIVELVEAAELWSFPY